MEMLSTFLYSSFHEKNPLLIPQSKKEAFLLRNLLDTHASHGKDKEQSDDGDEVFEEI